MAGIIFLLVMGAILLHFSLKLEIETTGKDSKEYKSLKYVAGGGLIMAIVGTCGLLLLKLFIAIFLNIQ